MKQLIKVWKAKGIYVCVGCILLGFVVIWIGFAMENFDVYAMQTVKHPPYKTVRKTLDAASLQEISMDTHEGIISIEPSQDDKIHISYQENKEYPVTFEQTGTTLELERTTSSNIFQNGFTIRWFDFTNDERIHIRVQLPKAYTGKLKVEDSYADITMRDIVGLQDVELQNEQGDITISNVSTKKLNVHGSYNEVKMENIACEDEMLVSIDQGNLDLNQITANSMKLNVSYGLMNIDHMDVKETLDIESAQTDLIVNGLTAGVFSLQSEYGDLQFHTLKATTSAQFDLAQSELQIQQLESKALTLESDYGDIQIHHLLASDIQIHTEQGYVKAAIDESMKNYAIRSSTTYGDSNLPTKANENASKKLEVISEYGDIHVEFLK